MNYLALGDSISIDDYTEVAGGGAANQFARLIGARNVQNLTADGLTTDGVLASLARVTVPPDIVTLTAGGNDFLQAVFQLSVPPRPLAPNDWLRAVQPPIDNLKRIAEQLAAYRCPVIINTVYDPSDGDNMLAAQMGLPPEARRALHALNAGIKEIAQQHSFLLSDLEALFHGHGLASRGPWFVLQIEPNFAGATAIAVHWYELYQQSQK